MNHLPLKDHHISFSLHKCIIKGKWALFYNGNPFYMIFRSGFGLFGCRGHVGIYRRVFRAPRSIKLCGDFFLIR